MFFNEFDSKRKDALMRAKSPWNTMPFSGKRHAIHIFNPAAIIWSIPSPKTMIICKVIVLKFQQSRELPCPSHFIVTEQHCSKGEKGKSLQKAKLVSSCSKTFSKQCGIILPPVSQSPLAVNLYFLACKQSQTIKLMT